MYSIKLKCIKWKFLPNSVLLDILRNLGYGFTKRSFKSCILRKTKTFLLHTSSQGITYLAHNFSILQK